MIKNRYILFVYITLTTGIVFTEDKQSLQDYAVNSYLLSHFGVEEIIAPEVKSDQPKKFWEDIQKQIEPEIKHLRPRENQEIAFKLTQKHRTFNSFELIDSTCATKLELAGGAENSANHLFGKILEPYLRTSLGKAHAVLTLCDPIANSTELSNRQHVITQLNKHKSYTQKIGSCLKSIQNVENESLMVWANKPLFKQDLLNAQYFSKWFSPGGISNTNTFLLEATAPRYLAMQMFAVFAGIPTVGMPYLIHSLITESQSKYGLTYIQAIKHTAHMLARHYEKTTLLTFGFGVIVGNAYFLLLAKVFYMAISSTNDLIKYLQDGLRASALHIKELKKLSNLIRNNKALLQNIPSLQPLADFNDETKHSKKLNKLLRMLKTPTFKSHSSFFSIQGRVLAAYELMKQVKDELAPVFVAAGELDTYVALAQLYSEYENKNARYCMVNYIQDSATPVIDAHNFWNPFISADTVVTNSITFDSSCPNSILTGPNTGGKSTVIKALMINVLLAQTFGIAAADSFSITPFSKLNCFMNISDDIATGASLFKSEVMRAKGLLDMVQGLQQHEFSFVIIDEVFTGTSPQEGEAAAMQFTKKLGSYSNNIGIIATHYPKMTELEAQTDGVFINHHIEILRNEDGSLNRTFKLKNGPTFFNVAFDILEEEGLFV